MAHTTQTPDSPPNAQAPRPPAGAPPADLTPPPPADRRYVVAALMLVMVLASMEQTITSTAMPTIIGELHGFEEFSAVAAVYLLAATLSMPLYGRLADVFGRKRVIVVAIALFSLASLLASAAHTMPQLILCRGLQGLGAGGIMPVVLTILGDIFTLRERARIQGAFSAIWGTAALAGPALGAFLVNALGWRSIFWVNLPFGALGLYVLTVKYHDHNRPHSTVLDLPGLAALSAACAAALMLASGLDTYAPRTLLLLGTATILALLLFVWNERRSANPIMPPNFLTHRAIGPALLCSLLFGIGFLSLDTYVPLYVQGGRGGGVTAAASVVTPIMLTWALSGMIAAPLLVRWGFRRTALTGACLITTGFLGLYLCARFDAPHLLLTAVLALTGLGFGPASMSYLLSAQEAVEWQQRGLVTSAVTFFRTVGGALGISLLGAIFNRRIAPELASLRRDGLGAGSLLDPKTLAAIPPQMLARTQHMIAHGLLLVFLLMFLVVAAQALVTTLMPSRKCAHRPTAVEGLDAIA